MIKHLLFKKWQIIAITPLVFLVIMAALTKAFNMISQPSDLLVLCGVILLGIIFTGIIFFIKLIK